VVVAVRERGAVEASHSRDTEGSHMVVVHLAVVVPAEGLEGDTQVHMGRETGRKDTREREDNQKGHTGPPVHPVGSRSRRERGSMAFAGVDTLVHHLCRPLEDKLLQLHRVLGSPGERGYLFRRETEAEQSVSLRILDIRF